MDIFDTDLSRILNFLIDALPAWQILNLQSYKASCILSFSYQIAVFMTVKFALRSKLGRIIIRIARGTILSTANIISR